MVKLSAGLYSSLFRAILLLMILASIGPAQTLARADDDQWVREIRREMGAPISATQIENLTLLIRNIKNENALTPQDGAWLKKALVSEASRGERSVDSIPLAAMLLEAVKLFPRDIQLRVKFAKALMSLAQFQEATRVLYSPADSIFEKETDRKGHLVFKDEEARIVAYAIQGSGVLGAGKVHEARKLYQMAIKGDPGWSGAYYLMGALEIGQKRFGEARKYLNKALEVNPANEGAKDLLGTIKEKE